MSKILLLEDDLSLINGLSFAFKKQGFELVIARTLKEANELWDEGKYDLLVLDVSLSDGTGFGFCKKVRQVSKVPIIFLTASDEETNIIMGLDIVGDDYITKPFYVLVVFYCSTTRLQMLYGQGIIAERKFENYTLITKIYDTLSLEVIMQRILVVEDDFDIQELLQNFLQEAGYEVAVANDGVEALSLFAGQRYDLIVLDIMLPKIDGYGVCELIRKQSDVPIIMLTALSGEEDQIKGLDLQVDDYITKPFSMPVLLRKIAAVLRRSNRKAEESYQVIAYSNLLLNCDSYTATVDGANFELTQKEFEILRELLTHQGRILTRQNLLDKLWRYDFYGDERVVDTHIKNLRKKLGIDFIQTIRGVGYKVDKEN